MKRCIYIILALTFTFAIGLYVSPLIAEEEEPAEEVEKEVVNINTATVEELQLLPGIGRKKAEAIIKYREEHGEFKSPEDIIKVRGIGKKLFERIKDMVVISGETTMKPKGKGEKKGGESK